MRVALDTESARESKRDEPVAAYGPPRPRGPIDLALDANEGRVDAPFVSEVMRAIGADAFSRYPNASRLEALIADRHGVEPERVIVTAGGDEAIDRLLRATLNLNDEVIVPSPSFVMIEKYARMSGGRLVEVDWSPGTPYPLDEVIARINERTRVIAVVSPNNPTGAVATIDELRAVSIAAPNATLLVDLAYAEFAEVDLTEAALSLPNAVVVRTFSKAFGLAGLRVGYAIGPADLVQRMRARGGPFPVSGVSLAVVEQVLRSPASTIRERVERIRRERDALIATLRELGAEAWESQGNFVLARFPDADWVWRALSGLGIATRKFEGDDRLRDCLRITLPGDDDDFARLIGALRAAIEPEAILFDLDGVLAEVTGSYRVAITHTAAAFGVEVTAADIARVKAAGDANNDWIVTQRLIESKGSSADLSEVTEQFESFYQGTTSATGLRDRERLIPSRALLERLATRLPIGIVTGRPRADAEYFLRRAGIDDLLSALVCMEDAPAKPDPAPIREALDRLGVSRAWMVGDTPDDLVAARRAGVVPIGYLDSTADTRVARESLESNGAARVLVRLDELEEMWS
ncbi:MAG: TIGR01548 family HAD-type hydrolase [Phycisphaerales bacterium]